MKIHLMLLGGMFLFNSLCFATVLNRVVAVVNGEVITEVDLIRFARKSLGNINPSELDEEAEDKILKKSLQDLIEDMLILSFAKKVRLKIDESEIEKRIDVVKGGFATEIEFLNALEKDGLSYEGLYQKIQDDILKKRIVSIFVNRNIEIHPREAREYFNTHSLDFPNPERIKVRKIYIRREEGVEKKVRQIRGLLNKNVAFEDLAINHSDAQGAYLAEGEWIEKGKLKENIESEVFILAVGKISSVIETDNGYYIFQVLDKASPGIKDFEEVRGIIYNKIYQEKFEIEFRKFIEDLKEDAYVEVKI
ncbi:MAG: peptidyl-prolyl cis-trans isomerase [Candidatus Saelkia tenebricola]|nr:peptidyl-prolyl cis-trans isomerase [Candidatus Saelkia tenebricola]